MNEEDFDRKLIAEHGTFSVELVASGRYDEDARLPAHDKVLRPLLQAATECWAYGVRPGSDVDRAAKGLLQAARGKHRVSLDDDPLTGHEQFWNAQGGRRGTIVILTQRARFDAAKLFRGCREAFVLTNFRSAHTPAALRFARERARVDDMVAVCLPRNNGIEWMDVHVRPALALEFFDVARVACSSP